MTHSSGLSRESVQSLMEAKLGQLIGLEAQIQTVFTSLRDQVVLSDSSVWSICGERRSSEDALLSTASTFSRVKTDSQVMLCAADHHSETVKAYRGREQQLLVSNHKLKHTNAFLHEQLSKEKATLTSSETQAAQKQSSIQSIMESCSFRKSNIDALSKILLRKIKKSNEQGPSSIIAEIKSVNQNLSSTLRSIKNILEDWDKSKRHIDSLQRRLIFLQQAIPACKNKYSYQLQYSRWLQIEVATKENCCGMVKGALLPIQTEIDSLEQRNDRLVRINRALSLQLEALNEKMSLLAGQKQSLLKLVASRSKDLSDLKLKRKNLIKHLRAKCAWAEDTQHKILLKRYEQTQSTKPMPKYST